MAKNGMHILHPFNNWPDTKVDSIRLWDCGVTWKDVNPSKGVFIFDRLDQIVDMAEKRGVKHITLVLAMTPQWASRDPNSTHYAPWLGPGTNMAPHTMSDWSTYVQKVVERYKGKIHAYQIWNEPQLKEFWNYNNYTVLAHMTALAYGIIKRIDKNALVVAAPILPRPSSGGVIRGSKYLSELKKRNWPIDIMSCHIYPEKDRGPARFNYLLTKVKAQLSLMKCPKNRLWITETNYNVPTGPNIYPESQVHWFIDKTNEILFKKKVERVFWYGWGHTESHMFGLNFDVKTYAGQAIKKYL
jgi:hypothetical protein